MKAFLSFLRIALLITALEISVGAASFTLNPTADAFVSSNPALNATGSAAIRDSNYGGAGALGVAAAGLSKGEFDSLLQFNLAAAKASFDATFGAGLWTISGITLQLTATGPNNSIFNGFGTGPGGSNVNTAGLFSVEWMQNDSWLEGGGNPNAPSLTGITFSTLPSFRSGADEPLGTFSFGGGSSGNETWSLGLGSSFVADSAAGNVVSLLLLPADDHVAYLSNSRSAGGAARPVLTISAVPEPSTAVFGICTAIVCALRRGRRQQTVVRD